MHFLLAGTPFESPFDRLTVPSKAEGLTTLSLSRSSRPRGKWRGKIEGVARPTATLKIEGSEGSARRGAGASGACRAGEGNGF
jgi:hypothetical protein